MGMRTKIDWCDSTWNPVTGCLHGCEYCYAQRIAERFGAHIKEYQWERIHVLDAPWKTTVYEPDGVTVKSERACPYPFDFEPTFHRYKLDEPQKWKKPRTIFVCSMADLFGAWVPNEWIQDVFAACAKAPQHRYLFLTKNPGRYKELKEAGGLPTGLNAWLGVSTPRMDDKYVTGLDTFVSIEPILEPFYDIGGVSCGWVIVGAETGNRKDKVVPKKDWIMPIVYACGDVGVPIFMKESLREIMGDEFRQEFPWEG